MNKISIFLFAFAISAVICAGTSDAKENEKPEAPVVKDIEAKAESGREIPIVLGAADPEGDPLEYIIVKQPSHGKLVKIKSDPAGRSYNYIPDQDFFGMDSFWFKVSDGREESEPAEIQIEVKAQEDAPKIESPGDMETEKGKSKTVDLTAFDPDGDDLRYEVDVWDAAEQKIDPKEIGLRINEKTGKVKWTPQGAGEWKAEFKVSDGKNEAKAESILRSR